MRPVGFTVAKSMLGFVVRSLLLLVIAQPAAAQEPGLAGGTGNPLAITSVSVVDVADGSLRSNQTVLVEGGRVASVGDADQVQVLPGATVINGTGTFLIPGLWDMHAHTGWDRSTREIIYPLFVAHGVTGIRSMKGDCSPCGPRENSIERVNATRRAVAAGEIPGPRVVASSALAGSYEQAARRSSEGSSAQAPATEADGRAFVRLAKERGVDFIKIYDMLPREAYFALAEEANGIGLPFAGHVPVEVRASEASDAGQASIDHLGAGNVLEECSSREDEIRSRIVAELEEEDVLPLMLEMVESYDAEKCTELAGLFARKGTWIVPTLMLARLPGELGRGWREQPYALLAGAEKSAGAEQRPDTIRVAAPAGQPDLDRPRVQEAFDRARPGDTVLFAAGTYVLGEGARLTVPDVTVTGHPDGTTIKGCEADRFDLPAGPLMENLPPIVMGCTGLFVLADRQTIRGLTFEHAWHGILIGHPPWLASAPGQTAPDTSFGGHRIESNVFRNVPNGIRVVGPSSEVTLIRDNEVINAYHAFLAEGATVHIVDNWITVPEPDSVPAAYYPESGVIVNPGLPMGRCEGSHVVGNVIDGTVNGIQILAAGGRGCTGHEIRDNVIRVRRVPLRPDYPRHLMDVYFGEDAEGTAVTGTAIRLVADSSATVTDVLIRNNRVLGGHGLGIQLERASGNRIAGNYISRIQRRSPFPGLTWGDDPERWRAANGSAIWISDGSANNVVEDNAFRDIEGPAIHLDGDDNEIRLNSGDPAVRDEGRGNRVVVAPPGDVSGQ